MKPMAWYYFASKFFNVKQGDIMKICPICDTDYPDQHNTCPTDGAVLMASQEMAAGKIVINKFKIVRTLGHGGMGIVYLAEHMMLGDQVALKFLASELSHNPEFFKRFRNEAKAAFSLHDPNIVQVKELYQTEDGSPFISMEYVDGKSLRAALEEERTGFEIRRALDLTHGIVSGLAAAHAQKTVHRDIKPENIVLAYAADGRETPKVLDFGIAAIAKNASQSSMSRGRFLTQEYAAPEQWRGVSSAELDGRTDLYAMGCVFYEMLTGHTPFHAHDEEGWSRQHQMETPRLPSESRAELANWPGLDGLVMRMLAKNRDDRPQDGEVLSELDAMQSGPVQRRTEQIAEYAHAPTVIERDWGHREQAVAAFTQPIQQPVPEPVIQVQKPAPQKVPVWVWGALAAVVVMAAAAAGFAAVHFFAPKSQSEQTQAQATQPAVIPPRKASSYSYTAPNPTTTQEKPSPGSKTDATLATGGSTNSQTQNSTQANNTRPSIVLPSVVLPKQVVLPQFVKQQAQQPNNAEITQQALALYGQKRFPEASPLLDKACSGGSGEACKDLGNMYHDGSGVGKDGLRAASLYSKSCSTSPPKGCTNLGVMYHNGDGVPQNDAHAGDLYSRACDAGDGIGCANLGNSYWNGSGVAHDDTRAAALYSRACDIGNGAGCSSLGLCYGAGRGVTKDTARARQLFTKGCGLGNQWGCDQLKKLK
jgi:serine/threonine-protein kinase